MSKIWNKFFVTLILLGTTVVCMAQPKFNSPYSRLGIGDLFDQGYASQQNMGGVGTAFNSFYFLNPLNPASYAHLKTTGYEVGVFGRRANLKSQTTSTPVWSGNLSYLSLGFPMKNTISTILDRKKSKADWGMGLSLVPFSTVGYDVRVEDLIASGDSVTFNYTGEGGTYRFIWSNGVKIKDFSVGVNISYLFGKITRETVATPDIDASYRDVFEDEISLGGMVWDLGAQYNWILERVETSDGTEGAVRRQVVFGLTGNSGNGFSTNSSAIYLGINNTYGAIDTVRFEQDVKGKGKLPPNIGFGVMYHHFNKMRLGLDFSRSAWSKYENDAKPETLANSLRLSIGGEFIPDASSYNKYGKRIRYRVGAFYKQDPRLVLNEQLTSYGITFGFGLPIILPRRETSFVNIGFEFGQFGNDLSLTETYGKFIVGFTLNDNTWFLKRKFN